MLDHHSRRVLAGTLSRHRTARETCRVLARAPHLELIALDYGDLGAVYGLDTE